MRYFFQEVDVIPISTLDQPRSRSRCWLRRQQHGSVAIEFAVLFSVFFTVLYAIIAYSIPLLVTLTFNQLSADAARAAVRVDPAIGRQQYAQAISNVVQHEVEQSWLPENWRGSRCTPPAGTGLTWVPLETPYGFLATEKLGSVERVQLHVCLQRKYNRDGGKDDGAIIPVLTLPGGLEIPRLPKDGSDTVLRGRSTVRL